MADGDSSPQPPAPAPPPAPENSPEADRTKETKQKKSGGLVSRVWKGIFGGHEDFEKLLHTLSKEEAAVHARLKRRARACAHAARNIVALAAALEVLAVAYAIMVTRSLDLSWQMRAVRVLPLFLIPPLAALIYSTVNSLRKMLDNRDQHTLEKLRAERQAKIDELKERTNYYSTQQLIQRYDLDPAAKAAAASVLASKLGADSGLRVLLGDESNIDSALGKSIDAQRGPSAGLRQRKHIHLNNSNGSSQVSELLDDSTNENGHNDEGNIQNQRIVGHYKGPAGNEGWIAHLAALLVGEDPTQCYALICGSCHMHNGLARKEDFSFITYYCPHCHALNGSRHPEEHEMASTSVQEAPTSQFDGSAGLSNASQASSIVSSPIASASATVQKLPAQVSDEKGGNDAHDA